MFMVFARLKWLESLTTLVLAHSVVAVPYVVVVVAAALRNLDENGIVQIGTFVEPGDILVGKVSPKSKTELTPEEKLLHAIFGRAGEDGKNDSLEVPSGIEGIVIDTQTDLQPCQTALQISKLDLRNAGDILLVE